MELAGVQAICDYYGWNLYDFLVTGDVLDFTDGNEPNIKISESALNTGANR